MLLSGETFPQHSRIYVNLVDVLILGWESGGSEGYGGALGSGGALDSPPNAPLNVSHYSSKQRHGKKNIYVHDQRPTTARIGSNSS